MFVTAESTTLHPGEEITTAHYRQDTSPYTPPPWPSLYTPSILAGYAAGHHLSENLLNIELAATTQMSRN